MSEGTRNPVRVADYIEIIRGTWFPNVLSLVLAIAAGVAVSERVADSDRLALISGALLFVALQLFALYTVVAKIWSQLDTLTSASGFCRILVGPAHARLLLSAPGSWQSDGVTWLAVSCDKGSEIAVTLEIPAGVTITWKYRDGTRPLWKRVGTDDHGNETWTTKITHPDVVTPLGQFTVSAREVPEGRNIAVKAQGKAGSGAAVGDTAEIGLFPDVTDNEALKPVD